MVIVLIYLFMAKTEGDGHMALSFFFFLSFFSSFSFYWEHMERIYHHLQRSA